MLQPGARRLLTVMHPRRGLSGEVAPEQVLPGAKSSPNQTENPPGVCSELCRLAATHIPLLVPRLAASTAPSHRGMLSWKIMSWRMLSWAMPSSKASPQMQEQYRAVW